MAVSKDEIEEIVRRVVAEMISKGMRVEPQKPAPKCNLTWKDDALVLECESTADRDRAKEILDKGEVIIKVKPKVEERTKGG
jgi:hypothetical protein